MGFCREHYLAHISHFTKRYKAFSSEQTLTTNILTPNRTTLSEKYSPRTTLSEKYSPTIEKICTTVYFRECNYVTWYTQCVHGIFLNLSQTCSKTFDKPKSGLGPAQKNFQ
jgi:hypothetical protein